MMVHRRHWFVFERSASLHFRWLLGNGTTCVLQIRIVMIVLGLALQAILLLVHAVLSVAHLLKVHYGGNVATRATASKVQTHLAQVIIATNRWTARVQIANRTGLLFVALLAEDHGLVCTGARTDHHIGSWRFACRLHIGLVVEPLLVFELIDDDSCIRICVFL